MMLFWSLTACILIHFHYIKKIVQKEDHMGLERHEGEQKNKRTIPLSLWLNLLFNRNSNLSFFEEELFTTVEAIISLSTDL